MFSFGELVVIVLVALVVLGPQKTHALVRTIGTWVGRARVYMRNLGEELERESETGDVMRELRQVHGMMRDQAGQFRASAANFEREARDTVRKASEVPASDVPSSDTLSSESAEADVNAVPAAETPASGETEPAVVLQPESHPGSQSKAPSSVEAQAGATADDDGAANHAQAGPAPAADVMATGSMPPPDVAHRGG